MKSFIANGSDPMNPEKFLAYMVPQPDEVYNIVCYLASSFVTLCIVRVNGLPVMLQ